MLQVFPVTPYPVSAFAEYSAVIAFPVLHRLPAPYSTHLHRYLYTQIFYWVYYGTIFDICQHQYISLLLTRHRSYVYMLFAAYVIKIISSMKKAVSTK